MKSNLLEMECQMVLCNRKYVKFIHTLPKLWHFRKCGLYFQCDVMIERMEIF